MRTPLIALVLVASSAAQAPIPAGKLPVPGDASHELQLYDLASLIETRLDLQQRGDDAGPALAEFARAFVQPSLGHAEDVRALGNHHLVGLGRAEVHGWVHGFLQAQLEQGDAPIDLQVRVLQASDKAMERVGLKREPVALADAETLKARLDKLHGSGLIAKLIGEPDVTEITAPRLLTLQLQRANISLLSQETYIKGYELGAATDLDEPPTAVPQHATVQDGIALDCRAAVVQKNRVGLFCKIEVTELDRPIQQEQTPHGPIGVPVVHRLEAEQQLDIPAAGGVLVPLRRDSGRHLVLVVTAAPGS